MSTGMGGALFLLALAGCASGGSGCEKEPEGAIVAFFNGGAPSRDVVAEVVGIDGESGAFRYRLREGSTDLVLTYRAAEPIPHIRTGTRYRFEVEYSMGSPDGSGIVIHEAERMIFAAMTDQRPRQHVLEEGIADFDVSLEPSTCSSRPRTKCHEALVNRAVNVTHDGRSISLHHGERAEIGDFVVHVLTAQSVTYSNRCSDAGIVGISLSISRIR